MRSRMSNRGFLFALILALAAGFVLAVQPTAALADTVPTPPEPPTVSVDALPTAQVNGVVWAQLVVGNTVWVGGDFTLARPAGAAPGVNTTPRSYLLTYNVSTGVLNSFAPTLNGQVLGLAKSPNGNRVYAVGDFTSINGSNRFRIAAFSTGPTPALISSFTPGINARARSVEATDTTVYVGGSFTAVNGVARTRLAAFQASSVPASDGALLTWAPSAAGGNGQVMGMALNPARTKLVLGGQFLTLNGASAIGMGAVDPVSGANVSWNASNLIKNGGTRAAIYSLSQSNGVVYGTGYVFGQEAGVPKGNLEGTFAADSATGDIKWIADCHGDHYSAFASNGAVYSVGHAHDCANLRGFGQTSPDWTFHRGLAMSEVATTTNLQNQVGGYFNFGGQPAPTLLDWYPDLQAGTFTGQT